MANMREVARVEKKRKPERRELVAEEMKAENRRSGRRGAAMNDSGPRTPGGEAPAGGSPSAPGRGPGGGARPPGDVVCGVCQVTLQLGHRAICFPCRQGRHVLHARRVVEALARGAMSAPLRYPAVNCGAQHPRHTALEAAIQADSGLHNRVVPKRGGGAEQPGYRASTRWCFLGRPGATSRNRENSTTGVGRRTCVPERSCA